MNQADGTGFSVAAASTADGLTNAQVLHPVASALAFIAFLIAVGAGFVGSLVGGIVALVAWIVTLVVMVSFTQRPTRHSWIEDISLKPFRSVSSDFFSQDTG